MQIANIFLNKTSIFYVSIVLFVNEWEKEESQISIEE